MKLVVRIRVVMVLQEVEEPKAHTGNTVMDVTPKASSIGYGLRNQYSVVPPVFKHVHCSKVVLSSIQNGDVMILVDCSQ